MGSDETSQNVPLSDLNTIEASVAFNQSSRTEATMEVLYRTAVHKMALCNIIAIKNRQIRPNFLSQCF